MKKLFALIVFVNMIFFNFSLFSQEESVESKNQKVIKEFQGTEKSKEANDESKLETKEKVKSTEESKVDLKEKVKSTEGSEKNSDLMKKGVNTPSSDEEASKSSGIKTFALDPNQVGALANSVNLFTGQVALPLNLISMSGRNGLAVNVSISYSSNVKKTVENVNLIAPTGVLGLGWQFSFSQITVDHKQTATREDDDFYLMEGGTSNKLICYQINTGSRKYKSKNYQFWDITYYNDAAEERWEIIKEDGVKYIYGGDLSSGRNTVQYVSKWGNWIGNSKQDGAISIAVGWNLSKVRNIWGEEITFAYEVTEVILGTSKQTEACYLKKITDNFNRQIEFYYHDKELTEYEEPHVELNEPDGYQERYEKRFLDSIQVRDAASNRLFSIKFNYEMFTNTVFARTIYKKKLISITQKNSEYEELPGLKFTYNLSTEPNPGALKGIATPTGASINYEYGSHQIEYSDLTATANAPTVTSGSVFLEPRVFIHANYTVITWRRLSTNGQHSSDFQEVMVQVWEWDGKWVKALEQSIGGIETRNEYQDFTITLQNDFFAILTGVTEHSNPKQSRYYFYSKNNSLKANWVCSKSGVLSNVIVKGELRSGKDFIAIKITEDANNNWQYYDYLYMFKKNELTWTTVTNRLALGVVRVNEFNGYISRNYIAADNNYLLLFKNASDPDMVQVFYFKENSEFCTPNPLYLNGVNAGSSVETYLYTNGGSLLLFTYGPPEYIYDWDDAFTSLTQRKIIGPYPDNSTAFSLGNNSYGIMKGGGYRSILARKDGIDWTSSDEGYHMYNTVKFGDDFFLWVDYGTDGNNYVNNDVVLREFNPNHNSLESAWKNDIRYTRANAQIYSYPYLQVGSNLFSLFERIYNRNRDGSWTKNSSTLFVPSSSINYRTIRHGNNFSVYESNYENTYFVPQRDTVLLPHTYFPAEKISNSVLNCFPKDKSELVGSSSFLTYNAAHFVDITNFNLHKVINEQATGKLTEYFVKGFTITNGYNNSVDKPVTTAIHYYPEKAVMDPSGMVVQYNKVRVIPGGSLSSYNPDIHPNGYTDNYFFNGLKPNELSVAFPANIANITNAENYYKLLTGNIYETDVYDNNNVLKSSTKSYWYTDEKTVADNKAYYSRVRRKDEMLDNVTKTTESTYSSTSGLVKTKQTYNYNTNGQMETLKTEYQYGYENAAYSSSLTGLNQLTLVIQTRATNGSTCIAMSATTLKQFNGVWAPHKSYTRTASGSGDFDFSLWSGTGEPTSDWLKTSEITQIDTRGQVLEIKDVDGIYSTTHWDKKGLHVASFSNTQNTNKTISENFDDLDLTDTQPIYWSANGTWNVNNLGALFFNNPNNQNSGTLGTYSSCTSMNSDFVAEFDVRIPSALTTSDWGGFHFRCSNPGDGPWTSGYTVFLRKNGSIELFAAYGTTLGTYQLTGTTAYDWQRIRVVTSGVLIQIYVNGIRRISAMSTSYWGSYFSFYAYRSQPEFDNLLIYPQSTYASIKTYDPKFLLPLSTIDAKGNRVKNVFDSFQRKIGTVGPTNIPVTTTGTFLSLDRYTTFSATDPNSSLLTTVHGNFGIYNDFSTHLNNWTFVSAPAAVPPAVHSISNYVLENGKLKHTDSGNTNDWNSNLFYTDLGTGLTGRVAIEFSVKIDALNSSDGFGIGIGDNFWNLDGNNAPYWDCATWTYFHGNNQLRTNNQSSTETLADWLTPGQYHRIQIVLDVTTKKADFFVDGKACLSNFDFVKSSTANIRKITFFNYGRNGGVPTTWYIDDFMVYTEPSHSMVFTDGAGKTLQTQSEESSSSIINTATVYDDLGRDYVQTMPVRLTSRWLGYDPNFVTSFDAGTGTITGTVLVGSVDAYPYSRTVYETSPIGRAVEKGQPGNELRIGNGHTIKNQFSYSSYSEFPIGYPHGQGFETVSINADGIYSYELKDKLGRAIATKSGPVKGSSLTNEVLLVSAPDQLTNSFTPNMSQTVTYAFTSGGFYSFRVGTTPGGFDILPNPLGSGTFSVTAGTTYYLTLEPAWKAVKSPSTSLNTLRDDEPITEASVQYKTFVTNLDINPFSMNEYDVYGNLTKIYPPNYFNIPDPSSDPNGYVITMTYDFNRRLKTKHSDDFGTSRYIYDKAGRLRFSMDANGEAQATDNVKYIKYDALGRVSEDGYLSQNWDEATLQNYANTNPAWPTTPATWRMKYTYGSHGDDVYQRGEVTLVQTNNDGNTTAEVTESTTYNLFGDQTMVSTTTGGINHTIGYSYNYDGQVNTINYGATSVYYTYDRLGRVSAIGTSSDPDYYASYSYANYNGSLYQEKLNNNTVTRTLTYNNHGWLGKIEDGLMSEEMFYHSGGYGGTGYYNGNIAKIAFSDKTISVFGYYAQFKYDNVGRLLIADHANYYGFLDNYDLGLGTGNEIKFDSNGNLLFVREGTTNRNYKYYTSTNLIKNTVGNNSVLYTHDSNGNINYSAPKSLSLSYDPYFNLTTQTSSTSGSVSFYYGADLERVYKQQSINGNPTVYKTYYYRGQSDYPLVEKNYQNTTLISTTLYIYGPTGLIVVVDGSSNKYILKDHLGSTRMVLSSSNGIDSRYNYAPFGRVMFSSVSTDVPYKFTGQEYDDENGLHNFRARLYDAELGLFYAYDPAGQGFSPFGYCGNNPVMYIDKDGRAFIIDDIVASIIIVATLGGVNNAVAHASEIHNGWDFGNFFIQGFARTGMEATAFAMVLAGIPPPVGFLPGLAYGITVGSTISGAVAAVYRENVLQAMIYGGIFAGVTFGVNGIVLANELGLNPLWGTELESNLPEIPKITGKVAAPKMQTKQLELPKADANINIKAPSSELPHLADVELISGEVHGNSLKSLRPTWGYKLYKKSGEFLKNGITSQPDPLKRYTKAFMSDKIMVPQRLFPNRLEAWQWEAQQNKILRGPLNLNGH